MLLRLEQDPTSCHSPQGPSSPRAFSLFHLQLSLLARRHHHLAVPLSPRQAELTPPEAAADGKQPLLHSRGATRQPPSHHSTAMLTRLVLRGSFWNHPVYCGSQGVRGSVPDGLGTREEPRSEERRSGLEWVRERRSPLPFVGTPERPRGTSYRAPSSRKESEKLVRLLFNR